MTATVLRIRHHDDDYVFTPEQVCVPSREQLAMVGSDATANLIGPCECSPDPVEVGGE
jgi:hypothetical protein